MKRYAGICCGGPADGNHLFASLPNLIVPVLQGYSEDGPVFGEARYSFVAGLWVYQRDNQVVEKRRPRNTTT